MSTNGSSAKAAKSAKSVDLSAMLLKSFDDMERELLVTRDSQSQHRHQQQDQQTTTQKRAQPHVVTSSSSIVASQPTNVEAQALEFLRRAFKTGGSKTTGSSSPSSSSSSSSVAFADRCKAAVFQARLFETRPLVPILDAPGKAMRKQVSEWLRGGPERCRVDQFAAYLSAKANSPSENNNNGANEAGSVIGGDDDNDAMELRSIERELKARAGRLRFDRCQHRYYLDAASAALPRNVTTVLDEVCGAFDQDSAINRMLSSKSRWRANKYYQTCNNDEFGNQLSNDQISKRIKREWENTRDMGVKMHEYIESRYKREAGGGGTDGVGASDDNDTIAGEQVLCDIQPEDRTAFERWEQIRMANCWLLLASEYTVFDEKCGLAGTVDAIYIPNVRHPRQVVLVDWKRASIITAYGGGRSYDHPLLAKHAKSNYWKYAMQLNVYRELLERNNGLHVLDMYLVSFPPRSNRCELFGVPSMPEAKVLLAELESRELAVSTTTTTTTTTSAAASAIARAPEQTLTDKHQ